MGEVTLVEEGSFYSPAGRTGRAQAGAQILRFVIRTGVDLAALERSVGLDLYRCQPRRFLASSFLYFQAGSGSKEETMPPVNPENVSAYEQFRQMSLKRGFFEYFAYVRPIQDTAPPPPPVVERYKLTEQDLCVRLYGAGVVDSITSNWMEVGRDTLERAVRARR